MDGSQAIGGTTAPASDFVVDAGDALIAIEVKSGSTLRPADRRGLLAFHDEFPDARLLVLTDGAIPERQGPIQAVPLESFLRQVVPGDVLPYAG